MEQNTLISIGELSKICNVSHKTLRYYDELNLLKPAMINPQNGYRFYTKWHITRVMVIKQLQDIGISLNEINKFLEQDTDTDIIGTLEHILTRQEAQISNQIKELSKKIDKVKVIQSQCRSIQNTLNYNPDSKVIIKHYPQRAFIYKEYIGKCTPDTFREYFKSILDDITKLKIDLSNICSLPMAVYEYSQIQDFSNIKIGYETQANSVFTSFTTTTLPCGTYASYIHKGTYSSLRTGLYKEIYSAIINLGFKVLSPSIEIYYISETIATREEDFLTEIQIPIK